MNYCHNCGNKISEGSKFCGKCGSSITSAVTSGSVTAHHTDTSKENFFNKKASRSEYFLSMIFFYGTIFLMALIPENDNSDIVGFFSLALLVLFCISVIYYFICLFWRFNDLNKPKWYIILIFVPIANFLVSIEALFNKGSKGNNNQPSILKICPNCKREYSGSKENCGYCNTELLVKN